MSLRRADPRIDLNWTVCVIDGAGALLGLCKTANVSKKGAKLIMQSDFDIPNLFSISFSSSGEVTRQCRVVWRDDKEVGVRFTGPESVS